MMLFESLLFVMILHGVLGRFWSMLCSFCPSHGFTLRVLHEGFLRRQMLQNSYTGTSFFVDGYLLWLAWSVLVVTLDTVS